MKVASVCCVYNESHFLAKHLNHMPDWVQEQVVLLSAKPWYGDELADDGSERIAKGCGATVLKFNWPDEVMQRNAGQEYLWDFDWILNLEPDEFLSDEEWQRLYEFIWSEPSLDAYVTGQRIFWGKGMESDPPEDFKPIVLTRPHVRFTEKRNVDCVWDIIPDLTLYHWAWARTDSQIWKKVSHYSHAVDFDIKAWFRDIWLARATENVHPTTASSIPRLIPAVLPPELENLNLFPERLEDMSDDEIAHAIG